MSDVAVTPKAVVDALHQAYGRQVADLTQQVAELIAVNEVLRKERDEYREAAQGGAQLVEAKPWSAPEGSHLV